MFSVGIVSSEPVTFSGILRIGLNSIWFIHDFMVFFVSSVLGVPWLLSDGGRACFNVFWQLWRFIGYFIHDSYVILAFCSYFNLIARCVQTKCSVSSFSYYGVF